MQATKLGGLNGKARTLRLRDRASRLHAQQLLEEYYDPDLIADRRDRYIPIGSRSEFLPAVTVWRDESNEDERVVAQGVQFELLLDAAAPAPADSYDAGVNLSASQTMPVELRHVIEKPPTDWAKPKVSFQPLSCRNARGSFDPKRFLYGCLLGSAAAAVVLLMVSVAFG